MYCRLALGADDTKIQMNDIEQKPLLEYQVVFSGLIAPLVVHQTTCATSFIETLMHFIALIFLSSQLCLYVSITSMFTFVRAQLCLVSQKPSILQVRSCPVTLRTTSF